MFSLKHAFTSLVEDEDDDSIVRPSDWNREHSITASAFSVLGRGGDADGDVSAIVADTESTFLGRFNDGVRFGVITAAVVSGLGSAALASTSDFATAAQGALAQTAVQPGSLGYFATGTDAANLTGTVASARISGAYTGITGVGTLTSGAVPTSLLTGTLGATQFPVLTGDVTTAGGALATTLATVNATVGSFSSATASGTFTVNAKGLITAAANVTITPAVGSITGFGTGVASALGNAAGGAGGFALASTNPYNLTGDVTSAGSVTTLATAQPAVHTWALSQTFTVAPIFTDASGSRTALGLGSLATLSAAPAGTLTGTTLASNVVTSSLTTIGTLAGGSIPTSLITGLAAVATSASASDLSTGTLPSARIDVTAAYAFTGLGATTISAAASGAVPLTISGYSLSGSQAQSMVSWAGTLNTSGSPDVVKWSITDTARGASTKLFNIYGGSAGTTSELSLDRSGNLNIATNFTMTNATAGIANGGGVLGTETIDINYNFPGITIGRLASFAWSSNNGINNQDVFLSRGGAAATLQLGAATGSGAAVAQTLTVQGSSGNSAAAALFTIAGSDQAGTTTTGGGIKIRGGNGTTAGGTVEIWTSATTTPAVAITVAADKTVTLASSITATSFITGSGATFSGTTVTGTSGAGLTLSNTSDSMVLLSSRLGNANAGRPAMTTSAASATAPAFIPNNSDTTTGIGAQASGNMSLIVGATEIARVVSTGLTMNVAKVLSITSGTNQRAGDATLGAGGTVTVNNTTVTANTRVYAQRKSTGGTIGMALTYTVSAGTSFTLTSDNILDTSVYSYILIEVP